MSYFFFDQSLSKLHDSGKFSCTRMSELLKQKLDELGYPSVEFSPHSLRAGGATAAGVPDRIFNRYGRWKSKNVKDGYVKDSLEKRLLLHVCVYILGLTSMYAY